MDTNNNFYYSIYECEPSEHQGHFLLEGIHFNGGINAQTLEAIHSDLWFANALGISKCSGKISSNHRQGKGYALELQGQPFNMLPGLLTTDPNIRWVFSGKVEASANQEICGDLLDALDSSIPVCGEHWLGVLRHVDHSYVLDAFAYNGLMPQGFLKAYSPDWGEGLEEDDAIIFTIRIQKSVAEGK